MPGHQRPGFGLHAAERRLQRHLKTARRRDSRPVSFSRSRKSNEEYLQQIEGSLAV